MSFELKINLKVVGYLLRVPHNLQCKQIQQQGPTALKATALG